MVAMSGADGAKPSDGQRDGWSSRSAFILAAIGSAVGLGNLVRFPAEAGANGGGAFVNQYSLVVDLFSPVASRTSWRTIYQTSTSNGNDGEYFIRPDNSNLGVAEMLQLWDEAALIKVLEGLDDPAALLASLEGPDIDALLRGPDFEPVTEDDQSRLDEKKLIECPECGHAFSP